MLTAKVSPINHTLFSAIIFGAGFILFFRYKRVLFFAFLGFAKARRPAFDGVLAGSRHGEIAAVDKNPVTPGEVLPARELYADMLLETGDPAGALAQYRVVLENSPNRLNALLGAAKAAAGSGDKELAADYYSVVRQQTESGNRQRAGLGQAWEAAR